MFVPKSKYELLMKLIDSQAMEISALEQENVILRETILKIKEVKHD